MHDMIEAWARVAGGRWAGLGGGGEGRRCGSYTPQDAPIGLRHARTHTLSLLCARPTEMMRASGQTRERSGSIIARGALRLSSALFPVFGFGYSSRATHSARNRRGVPRGNGSTSLHPLNVVKLLISYRVLLCYCCSLLRRPSHRRPRERHRDIEQKEP